MFNILNVFLAFLWLLILTVMFHKNVMKYVFIAENKPDRREDHLRMRKNNVTWALCIYNIQLFVYFEYHDLLCSTKYDL